MVKNSKKKLSVREITETTATEEVVHEHGHAHGAHTHTHTHTQTKAVLNRMARLIGHLQSVRRMVEEGRD